MHLQVTASLIMQMVLVYSLVFAPLISKLESAKIHDEKT
jgi:hypothetical protein